VQVPVSQLHAGFGAGPEGSQTAQTHAQVVASRWQPARAVMPSGWQEQSHWQVLLFQVQVPWFCGIGPGSQTGQMY
jgi:hypothetical protein